MGVMHCACDAAITIAKWGRLSLQYVDPFIVCLLECDGFFKWRSVMFTIGLTGGIGTGKTQVSKLLEGLGAAIVNADLLGHEIYKPHTNGWREVVSAFGERVIAADGEIDRRALGGIVFSDADALKRLNAITHPRIYALAAERLADIERQGGRAAVLEAALLIEAQWTGLVNEVWVTISPESDVIRRLQARNNMDADTARARIDSQMPQSQRVEYADVVIDNSGSLERLDAKVRELWNGRVITR